MTKITDKELNRWGGTMASRVLQENISGLRHCNFQDPSEDELRIIEHFSRAISYGFHIGKYRINVTKRFAEYRRRLVERDIVIRKLRAQTMLTYAGLPDGFFEVTT